jgi:hypothetical protein
LFAICFILSYSLSPRQSGLGEIPVLAANSFRAVCKKKKTPCKTIAWVKNQNPTPLLKYSILLAAQKDKPPGRARNIFFSKRRIEIKNLQ